MATFLTFENWSYLRVKLRIDMHENGDQRISAFPIEYFCEKVCETALACSYGAQIE